MWYVEGGSSSELLSYVYLNIQKRKSIYVSSDVHIIAFLGSRETKSCENCHSRILTLNQQRSRDIKNECSWMGMVRVRPRVQWWQWQCPWLDTGCNLVCLVTHADGLDFLLLLLSHKLFIILPIKLSSSTMVSLLQFCLKISLNYTPGIYQFLQMLLVS